MNKFILSLFGFLVLSASLISAQDRKVSDLPRITPSGGDLTLITHDPSGTPVSRASTVDNFRSFVPLAMSGTNANAFDVGQNGSTNPAFRVDTNTGSSATGLSVTSQAAGSGVILSALSSGSNETIYINAKGSTGNVRIGAQSLEINGSTGNGVIGNTTGDLYITNYGGGRDTFIQVAGIGLVDFSDRPGETAFIQDQTPTTGVSTVIVQAGEGQSTSDLIQYRGFNSTTLSKITSTGGFQAPVYLTITNCADSAGAAACGSAASGSFVVDAAGTATVVSTSAVTANSQVFLTEDSSLSTRLGVTCNATPATALTVTARTASTSFTVTTNAPTTNPRCVSYFIMN